MKWTAVLRQDKKEWQIDFEAASKLEAWGRALDEADKATAASLTYAPAKVLKVWRPNPC